MARRHSRSEAAMEALLAKLDPSSERFQVLTAAREFKASWVELGERLTVVRESSTFGEWGHPSFEAYCRNELHIKMDTANKLTRSFAFLRDHEPTALAKKQDERDLPPLEVVDLLSRARERAKLSDAQFASIEKEVFESPAEANRGEVLKRFRELDPEAFKPAARTPKAGAGEGDVRKALLLAERLQSLLEANDGISREARQSAKAIVHELRQLFEQSQAVSA